MMKLHRLKLDYQIVFFFGKPIIFSYLNRQYVNINIEDFSACYGGLLLAINGILYLCVFSSNGLNDIRYIGGAANNPNPYIPMTTVINKTIKITANDQYTHWLGIIYGQITYTIQSISI